MTDVAIPAIPPGRRASVAPFERPDLEGLFRALTADAVAAAHESGGTPLIAIPADDEAARTYAGEINEHVLPDGEAAAVFPVQDAGTGLSPGVVLASVRERWEAASGAVLDPATPFVLRRHLDSAAMRLRRDDFTIGPTPGGGWYFLGTTLPGEEVPATVPTAVDELVRALDTDGGRTVGFLPFLPAIRSADDLRGAAAVLAGMRAADRPVAPFSTAWLERVDTATTDTS